MLKAFQTSAAFREDDGTDVIKKHGWKFEERAKREFERICI